MTSSAQTIKPCRQLPGELGLWIFIASDLILFTLYFALFAFDFSADPTGFETAQSELNGVIGLINTLILLTGSWAVAMGTRVPTGAGQRARWIYLAALCGVVFLGLKAFEYAHLISQGLDFTSNKFFIWYFFLTGYHAVHVLSAIALLIVIGRRFQKERPIGEKLVEGAGCYWHLVDLLWIGIFSLTYLI